MKNFLKIFPITTFSVVIGLIGVSLATDMAQNVFQFQFWVNRVWLGIGYCTFALVLILYILKLILQFGAVKDELKAKGSLNYLSLISISFMLVSQGFRTFSAKLALILVFIGTFLQLIFFLIAVSNLFRKEDSDIDNFDSSFIFLSTGNLLIPVFAHQIFPVYIEWFFFSTGVLFFFVGTIITIYKAIKSKSNKDILPKSLMNLLGSSSLASLSFFQLTGQRNPTVLFFYCIGFFLFLLILFIIDFLFKFKFDISVWLYTFSFSIFLISSFFLSGVWNFLKWFGLGILIIDNLAILALLIMTLIRLIDGKLFFNEEK